MYIFTRGKKEYLEFLRNLTPQILLLTMALLTGSKLDLSRIDWSFNADSIMLTGIFYMLVFLFCSSVYVNIDCFLEKYIATSGWKTDPLRAYSGSNFAKLKINVRRILKGYRWHVLDFFFTVVLIELALMSVLLASVFGASNWLSYLTR